MAVRWDMAGPWREVVEHASRGTLGEDRTLHLAIGGSAEGLGIAVLRESGGGYWCIIMMLRLRHARIYPPAATARGVRTTNRADPRGGDSAGVPFQDLSDGLVTWSASNSLRTFFSLDGGEAEPGKVWIGARWDAQLKTMFVEALSVVDGVAVPVAGVAFSDLH